MGIRLFSLLLAILQSSAFAQIQPLEDYKKQAEGAVFVCSLAMRVHIETRPEDSLTEFQKCIADGKSKVKTTFDATLKAVRKPKAKEALKAFQAAFLSAMDATSSRGSDSSATFNSRQSAAADKMADAWSKFEVEQ